VSQRKSGYARRPASPHKARGHLALLHRVYRLFICRFRVFVFGSSRCRRRSCVAVLWWPSNGHDRDPWCTGATNKPTAPPEGFAELQQQLKSIATDLAAVRNTLEQQSAANHDQLTRTQEQISQQSIALLSSSPLADKPVHTPLPKPAQHPVHVSTQEHPAHVSTQDSSKPIQPRRQKRATGEACASA
jgi:hypothetical protein